MLMLAFSTELSPKMERVKTDPPHFHVKQLNHIKQSLYVFGHEPREAANWSDKKPSLDDQAACTQC